MQYLDFDLAIAPGSGGIYPVAVYLPAGVVQGRLRFPFEQQALELYLSKLETALLRSRVGRRRVLLPQEESIREFGSALFDALIIGDVRTIYDQQRAKARQQGMGVRIRLLVEAPELATLPWEYLRDPRQADFLCLSPQTPLVRYVKIPQSLEPLKVQPPLRILGMVASPSDQDPLDVAGEQARLSAALQPLEAQGIVKLRWVPGQTWQALQEMIWHGPWQVFHFIGHGAFHAQADEGMLALADPQGKTHLLPGSHLGRLLANGSLRLVVLNACEGAKGSTSDLFSSTGAALVRREIPAVVAMQAEISDAAALEFTRTFYKALASGLPVDAALAEARTAIWISIPNTLEWGTPVLYLRAPDGVLFDVTATAADEHAARSATPTIPAEAPTMVTPPAQVLRPAERESPEGQERSKETVTKVAQTPAWLMIGERKVLLNRLRTSIGRSPTNDVIIADDQQISGTHALLLCDGTTFTLQDVGSTNGTFLNAARITSSMVLHSQDHIRIGQHELVFMTAESPITPLDQPVVALPVTPQLVRTPPLVSTQLPPPEAGQKRQESVGSILMSYSGHTQPVRCLAWSPDGKQLVTASTDKTVQVWEALTGQTNLTYTAYLNELGVTDIAWSPDGTRIVSSGTKGVRVWEVATKRTLSMYQGHAGPVYAVTWSPESSSIASAGADGIHIWFPDAQSPPARLTYQRHPLEVRAVAWSPDGKRIASAGGRAVHIWDASNGELLLSYRSHAKQISDLAWSPDGQLLASCGDKAAQVRETTRGGHVITYKGHPGITVALTWSPDGNHIASVGGGMIQLWEAVTGKHLFTYRDAHFTSSTRGSIQWSPKEAYIASTHQTGFVQIWRGIG